MNEQRVRARVLDTSETTATLGIYAEGAWHRIHCRTEVALEKGDWIHGRLMIPPDGSMVLFRLEALENQSSANAAPPPTSGLDLEA